MMTASVIDDVMQIRSPKVSVAHLITSSAGASARASTAPATILLVGPCRPGGKCLARHPGRVEPAQYPLDVIRQLLGRGLQPPHLPAEARACPVPSSQASPEMDLEPFGLLAAGQRDQRSLQADVRRL